MALAEIRIVARDQTRAAFASVRRQLAGLGGIGGRSIGLLGRGLFFGALIAGFRAMGRAAEEMKDQADLSDSMRRNVAALNSAGRAWDFVKRKAAEAAIASAGWAIRQIFRLRGASNDDTAMAMTDWDARAEATKAAHEEWKRAFVAQRDAEYKYRATLLDLEDQIGLAVAERAILLRTMSQRDVAAREKLLGIEQHINDLTKRRREEAEKAAGAALEAAIEHAGKQEEFMRDHEQTALRSAIDRGSAVIDGGRAATAYEKQRKEPNDEETMARRLQKLARFDAGPNVRISKRSESARLALSDIDSARQARKQAEAFAREQARLQMERDAIPKKQLDELEKIRKGIDNMGLG